MSQNSLSYTYVLGNMMISGSSHFLLHYLNFQISYSYFTIPAMAHPGFSPMYNIFHCFLLFPMGSQKSNFMNYRILY